MTESFFEMIFGTKNLKKTESELHLHAYKGRIFFPIIAAIVIILALLGNGMYEYNLEMDMNGTPEKRMTFMKAVNEIRSSAPSSSSIDISAAVTEVFGEYTWVFILFWVIVLSPFVIRGIQRFTEISAILVKDQRIKFRRGFGKLEHSHLDFPFQEIESINLEFKGKHTKKKLKIHLIMRNGQEKRFTLPSRVFGQESLKLTADWLQAHIVS